MLIAPAEDFYGQRLLEAKAPDVIAKSGTASHPIVMHTGDLSDSIQGTAFLITEEELNAADAYEVSNYKRVQVRLRSGTESWVYVAA